MSQLTLEEIMETMLKKAQTLFCRLTLDVTKEELLNKLKERYPRIIVSEEVGTRNHFHILLLHTDTNSKNARQNLRNYLKDLFPNLKGNSDYAITQTHEGTTARLAAYTIKEGNFVQEGFPQQFIDKLQNLSYKKFDGKKFQDRMNALDEEWYLNKDKTIEHWLRDYIALKVEYNQTMNPRSIVPMMDLRQEKKFKDGRMLQKILAEYNR